MIYCHKLYEHELGYRGGKPGGAGGFVYIPKSAIDYFPKLSSEIVNSSEYIRLVPFGEQHPVLAQYIWHNDKLILEKGSRNEHRIYLNEDLTDSGDFEPDNYLLIVKANDVEKTYFFKTLNPKDDFYNTLDTIFADYVIRKNGHNAFIPTEEVTDILEELEQLAIDPFQTKIADSIQQQLFDKGLWMATDTRTLSSSSSLVTDPAFREVIANLYNYNCAFSEDLYLFKQNDLINLEAAHIIPKAHGGGDNPKNGLPLIKDLHWAFDVGFLTVTSNYEIKIHEKISGNEYINNLRGKKITLPKKEEAYPSEEALNYHNKEIFGKYFN